MLSKWKSQSKSSQSKSIINILYIEAKSVQSEIEQTGFHNNWVWGIANAILLSLRIIYSDLLTEYKIDFGWVVMLWVLLYCFLRNENKIFSASMTSWDFAHHTNFISNPLAGKRSAEWEKGMHKPKAHYLFCYHIIDEPRYVNVKAKNRRWIVQTSCRQSTDCNDVHFHTMAT